MRIVGIERLGAFCGDHADCRSWVSNWIADVRHCDWETPHDVKARYQTASFLPDNVVIFNVKGNSYRLEVSIAYNTGILIIDWIGTHAEYSQRYK